MLTLVCGAWLGVVIAALAPLGPEVRRSSVCALAIGAAGTVAALALGRGGGDRFAQWAALLPALLLMKAAVIVAAARPLGVCATRWPELGTAARRTAQAAAVIGVLGIAVAGWGGASGGWPASAAEVLTGKIAFAGSRQSLDEAVEVARAVASRNPGAVIYVSVPDGLGFAVGLFAGEPRRIRKADPNSKPDPVGLELVWAGNARAGCAWPELAPCLVESGRGWRLYAYPGRRAADAGGRDRRGR